jgi:predicted small lipoprotein YifL
VKRTNAVLLALAAGVALVGCGGRQTLDLPPDLDGGTDAGTTSARATIGPVDLTLAPRELPTSCDQGIGPLAFDNPCLVGMNLAGNPMSPGFHEVECTLAAPGHPMTWAILLVLSQVAANPDRPVTLPGEFATPSPTSGMTVDVGGTRAGISSVSGTITFSRVDPANRSFIARFQGTMTWKEESGATFSCAVDAPFWGAPGSFR